MKILVTGGARSGKSTHAEALLAGHPQVTYVAPGRVPDGSDAEWADRVARHRAHRPEHWTTLETRDLAMAVTESPGAVLVDCLGTWLTGVIDDQHAWEESSEALLALVHQRLDAFTAALGDLDAEQGEAIVVVTNEVGMGVIPEHRSGRLFRDLLGTVNQRVAAECDEVHLVVAGRVLTL